MNPWEIIGNSLGWIVLGALALFMAAFIWAFIKVLFRRSRERKTSRTAVTRIMSSNTKTRPKS